MKTKTQKDIKKEVIRDNIFKALHIVGYASIGILALLGIVMGVQSCKRDDHQNNDSQQQLRKEPFKVLREQEITDLTGLTINFNDTLNLDISGYFDLYYTSNNQSFEIIRPADYSSVLEYYVDEDYSLYAYENNAWTNTAYKTINVTGGNDVTNTTLISWVVANSDLGGGDTSESDTPQLTETIYLNGYDYRGWFGNVDSETGLIQYQTSQAAYLTYGGVEWNNKGNGRKYNFVSMVIQPVIQDLVFAIGKEQVVNADNTTFYNGRTGQQLYGSDYNKFSFVSRIYYGYKEGYNGGEMESGTWEYRDTIYEMPVVSCRNTEASYVAGFLAHNYNIDPLYRGMEIVNNSGYKFNTPKYNDVSIVELWKMDLNNYIGISNPQTETNVFTMLSKAFNSMTSVLSIEILPHMTLGLFLFVPLVVGIVFAVIKIIKK